MMKMTGRIGGMGPHVGIGAPLLVVILQGAHGTMMTTAAGEMIDLIGIENGIVSVIGTVDGIAMMIRIIVEIVIVIVAIDTAMTSTAAHGTHLVLLGMTVRTATLAVVDGTTERRYQQHHKIRGACIR